MPRMMRFEHPGSLVHIMARGIEGRAIFIDIEDRSEFLKRFSLCLKGCGYKCLGWCLMENHYHLFLRTSEFPMSSLMRPLNGGYARWFNRKHKRRGYLFQDRFKSVLCQDLDYARQLIRYIHLNPLRASEAPSLAALKTWPWCGHGFILNARHANGQGFQDRHEVLRRFGETEREAIASYLHYLLEGVNKQNPEQSGALSATGSFEVAGSNKGWPSVIGDPEFARAAMARHEVALWRKHRQADYKTVLKTIAGDVCKRYAIDYESLFSKGRSNSRSKARQSFCARTHYEEKIPFAVIARFLGATIPPVMKLAHQGRKQHDKE